MSEKGYENNCLHIHPEILKEYEAFLQNREIRTCKTYMKVAIDFLSTLESGREVSDVDRNDFYRYQEYVARDENRSNKTVKLYMTMLKSFYRFLSYQELFLGDVSLLTSSIPVSQPVVRNIIDEDQMRSFLSSFSLKTDREIMVRTIIELLYAAALRISEVAILKIEHIHAELHRMTVFEPKTQNWRIVPVSDETLRIIEWYKDSAWKTEVTTDNRCEGFLFPQLEEGGLRSAVNRMLAAECARQNMPLLTSHSFRHSAATHMLSNGAGLRQVQAFLGHKNIGSTQSYTRVLTSDLEEVISEHHPRELERGQYEG